MKSDSIYAYALWAVIILFFWWNHVVASQLTNVYQHDPDTSVLPGPPTKKFRTLFCSSVLEWIELPILYSLEESYCVNYSGIVPKRCLAYVSESYYDTRVSIKFPKFGIQTHPQLLVFWIKGAVSSWRQQINWSIRWWKIEEDERTNIAK